MTLQTVSLALRDTREHVTAFTIYLYSPFSFIAIKRFEKLPVKNMYLFIYICT